MIESYGFAERNIRRHLNEDVVKSTVRDGFAWLVGDAKAGDRLVFHFSGHGSYTESENDDEAVDELLCLYDMNWQDPNSYLLDDELGELTASIPKGVNLTVILDSCHSGTGTRSLGTRRPKTPLIAVDDTASRLPTGDRTETVRTLHSGSATSLKELQLEPENTVVARFVEPNANHRELLATRTLNKLGRSLQRADLNHQLLAAASDVQPAADAFIEGDYHGAFSFFLSKAAKEGTRRTATQVVFEKVRRFLREGRYSQTPQLEGPFAGEALFGGESEAPHPTISNPSTTFPPAKHAESADPSNAAIRLSTLNRFLTVAEKFLDIADRLSRTELGGSVQAVESAARAQAEVVVYVHGISQHRPGYSDPWWGAMRPYLTRPMTKTEVLWSDIVNPRSAELRSALNRATEKDADLRRQIELELSQRIEADHRSTGRSRANRDVSERAESAVRGDGFSMDDFLRYMHDASARSQILQRFDSIVRPLLDNGAKVHVISHSWGTVVAYEGLRNLDALSLSGRVCNLFVVGSALSFGAVQSNLFGRVIDGRKPSHVDTVINLDAGGDPVGGSIAGKFEVDAEHLGLKPTGCATIPFSKIAINISCAHGSYFQADNTKVNRDIFAASINQ